ncbi:hypothetical protein [Qipengyuania soli]|uniref:Uncharacterized protein n=1 Tax=Qipengyuania soli TaxID=2782568 RepID=A0A7S8IUV6_9SPHN|nr:hypothetical protein [Qipengyuania soli]QPC99047.1 hypothetical protein IRL76_00190 [Qipengyuania soli]
MNTLKALASATALSATALVAVPAHAGPLGFLKKVVKQELSELAQDTAREAVDAATGTAKAGKKGKVEASWKVEEGEAAPTGDGGFRQEGGTTVPTADDVQAPQGETRGLLLPAVQPRFQGGVNVAVGDVNGDGRDGKPGMSQNGTTVPSADTVQAAKEERRASLLLPAVQKVAPEARPQRAKMVQNGTTVATAGEIKAPEQDD